MPVNKLLSTNVRYKCYFYHTFVGQYTMCCDVVLWKYHNYSIMAMQLYRFIYIGVNRKLFGFSEFYAIPRIMQLAVIQLAGVYCISTNICIILQC